MAKSSGGLLLALGAAALFLGGKKRKGSGTGGTGTGSGTVDGGSLGTPDGKGGGGSGSGGGSGKGGAPSNLAPDGIWVSADCKTVVFGDDTGQTFWDRKGLKAAEGFIEANYFDPYEIARSMVMPMAPCAAEFPVMEDGYSAMEEELRRELFNRNFKEVYYLIQFLHDNIALLMDRARHIVEFDDNCDVIFVGADWESEVAERMIRFYLEYSYPNVSDSLDHEKEYPTWPMADASEKNMWWLDNVVTAVINRMSPSCGIAIVEGFKKDPLSGISFFNARPGLEALYKSLHNRANAADENREDGIDFEMVDEVSS